MEDEELDYVPLNDGPESAIASEGEITSDGGPEEYYQTTGGTQDAEPTSNASGLEGYSAPNEPPPSALEQQLPAGLGEGSPQFGVTPEFMGRQLDNNRLRQVLEETSLNNDKRRYEQQAGRGEFSPQDAQRLQRINWGRSYVEGEVDAGRMTHRDGLRALQDIDKAAEPLAARKAETEAKAKNERYTKAMQDSKFAAMVEEQNAELAAKDVRRHWTETPDGGHVYTGKGTYHAPAKVIPFPEASNRVASAKETASLPEFAGKTPQELAKDQKYKEAAAEDYLSRRAEYGLEHNQFIGEQTPGKVAAAKRELSDYQDHLLQLNEKGSFIDKNVPESIRQRAGQLTKYISGGVSDVPAEQFLRQQGQGNRVGPQLGASYDDLSANAAPNPNPQQAANEYAAIQQAYPADRGGAAKIKDPRLIQRIIQLRRIMGMK